MGKNKNCLVAMSGYGGRRQYSHDSSLNLLIFHGYPENTNVLR